MSKSLNILRYLKLQREFYRGHKCIFAMNSDDLVVRQKRVKVSVLFIEFIVKAVKHQEENILCNFKK